MLTKTTTDLFGNRVTRSPSFYRIARTEDSTDFTTSVEISLDGQWSKLSLDGKLDQWISGSQNAPLAEPEQIESFLKQRHSLFEEARENPTSSLKAGGQQWIPKIEGDVLHLESADQQTKIQLEKSGAFGIQFEPTAKSSQTSVRHSRDFQLKGEALECTSESLEILDSFEGLVKKNKIPLAHYKSLAPLAFSNNFRKALAKNGFKKDKVVFRRIGRERLLNLFKTGSDRDANSTIFDLVPCDSDAATRAKHGIKDHQVTYAHTLDLKPNIIRHLNPPQPGSIAELISPYEENDVECFFVAWDADKVQKAPAAHVEYWLPDNPMDALALVMVPEEFKSVS